MLFDAKFQPSWYGQNRLNGFIMVAILDIKTTGMSWKPNFVLKQITPYHL